MVAVLCMAFPSLRPASQYVSINTPLQSVVSQISLYHTSSKHSFHSPRHVSGHHLGFPYRLTHPKMEPTANNGFRLVITTLKIFSFVTDELILYNTRPSHILTLQLYHLSRMPPCARPHILIRFTWYLTPSTRVTPVITFGYVHITYPFLRMLLAVSYWMWSIRLSDTPS
ncbi:hypothetical protein BJV78DRAFT_754288 [Lactifluus subvellereus]|nr:hypothetical protein BJV78DRAFT_754288 [Lactifluus subvellereus]